MKVTYATPFLVTLARLRRIALEPLASRAGGVVHMKRHQPGEASMKTRMLLGLIIFGMAASAVALSVQAHAQSPDHSTAMALQPAPGQFVTPTALRGADVKPK